MQQDKLYSFIFSMLCLLGKFESKNLALYLQLFPLFFPECFVAYQAQKCNFVWGLQFLQKVKARKSMEYFYGCWNLVLFIISSKIRARKLMMGYDLFAGFSVQEWVSQISQNTATSKNTVKKTINLFLFTQTNFFPNFR